MRNLEILRILTLLLTFLYTSLFFNILDFLSKLLLIFLLIKQIKFVYINYQNKIFNNSISKNSINNNL